jgi:hypothetical protein
VDVESVHIEADNETPPDRRSSLVWDGAFFVLLACTALIVLAVPVFPSQDGPVHLYYVDVLRGLLRHSGPYPQHFAIKTFLTPYALEYYAILALEMVFSPVMSEKLLVCGYILAFGLGFRYLVESVAGRRNPWTLAGIPFCMNNLVYMGFLNYSFGVALMLFMSGYWIRFSGRLSRGRVIALMAGLVLMLLTHPVPVAVFLLLIGLYFAADFIQDAAAGSWSWVPCLRARLRPLVLLAVMAGTAAVWVNLFVDRSLQTALPDSYVAAYGWVRTAMTELNLKMVAPFLAYRYRVGLVLLLGLAVLTLTMNSWKRGGRVSSALLALIAASAICFALYGIVPPDINGSGFFAERFPVFWAVLLIASAAALRPPRRWNATAGVIALCLAGGVLLQQWGYVSPIATAIHPVLAAAPMSAGSEGLIIGPPASRPAGLSFNPFLWSGAHYFRRSEAILANAPWVDLPIIMIGLVHADRWNCLDPHPATMQLSGAMIDREPVSELDFVVEEERPTVEMNVLVDSMGYSNATGDNQYFRVFRRAH